MMEIIIAEQKITHEELVRLKGDSNLGRVKNIAEIQHIGAEDIKNILEMKSKEEELFAVLKQDIVAETPEMVKEQREGGFLMEKDFVENKDKAFMVERLSKHSRLNVHAIRVKGFEGAIELRFIDKLYLITFMDKPFEEKVDEINEKLAKAFDTKEEDLRQAKGEFDSVQGRINDTRVSLTKLLSKSKLVSKRIEVLEKMEVKDKYQQELLNLASHPAFEDMHLQGSTIVFKTKYIDIYDPRKQGVVFKGNKYEIKLNMNNSDLRIIGLDGSRAHRSAWTSYDPHPHVAGDSGRPCLGSLSDTIAQLCNDKEVFAVFTVIVNFLETFNIEDYAGKRIRNWETLDGSDNPYDQSKKCTMCSERLEDDDYVYYCEDCGAVICDDCRIYDDNTDEYICGTCDNNRCTEEAHQEEECGEWDCQVCHNTLTKENSKNDWINASGEVIQICDSCVERLSE